MSVVWKYELAAKDMVEVRMPIGAIPLHVGAQNGNIFLWALVDPDGPAEARHFRIAGTGHPLRPESRHYIGTVELFDASLIFHIFEVAA